MNLSPKELLQEEIISYLLESPEYFEQTFTFLEKDYFDYEYSILFDKITEFYKEYKKSPGIKELILMFRDSTQKEKEIVKSKIKEINSLKKEKLNLDFLIDATEQYIKRKIFEKSIITGAEGLGSNDTKKQQEKLSESFKLAEEAVKISLKSDLGISFEEVDKLDFEIKQGILTNIPSFDKILGTGYLPGTLNSAMAPSGIGKTASLIAFACEFAKQKKDIVFISMEQSESEIYKRIYANLLDINVKDIGLVDKQVLKSKIDQVKPSLGNIIAKQYPAKRITPLGISAFLDKLENEKEIKNPILGLLKSDFMKNMDNSYAYIGSIAEELRAIAIERNIIILSPMQLNRCLRGDSILESENGKIPIKDIKVGDKILGKNGYVKVKYKIKTKKQKVYKIVTDTGKTIFCSGNHVFPTSHGEKSINTGLNKNDYLYVR